MRAVIRTSWEPESEDERQVVAEATRTARRIRQDTETQWEQIRRMRDLKIPDAAISRITGQSRSTLLRRLGPRADEDPGAG